MSLLGANSSCGLRGYYLKIKEANPLAYKRQGFCRAHRRKSHVDPHIILFVHSDNDRDLIFA